MPTLTLNFIPIAAALQGAYVDADVDVATSERPEHPSLARAPGRVLAGCPAMTMWTELRRLMPDAEAARAYEDAAAAVRAARA